MWYYSSLQYTSYIQPNLANWVPKWETWPEVSMSPMSPKWVVGLELLPGLLLPHAPLVACLVNLHCLQGWEFLRSGNNALLVWPSITTRWVIRTSTPWTILYGYKHKKSTRCNQENSILPHQSQETCRNLTEPTFWWGPHPVDEDPTLQRQGHTLPPQSLTSCPKISQPQPAPISNQQVLQTQETSQRLWRKRCNPRTQLHSK